MVAQELLELSAEIVGGRDRGLGPAVVLLFQHPHVHLELEVAGDDLVVQRPPSGDLVRHLAASAGTGTLSTCERCVCSAATACGCSAFIR